MSSRASLQAPCQPQPSGPPSPSPGRGAGRGQASPGAVPAPAGHKARAPEVTAGLPTPAHLRSCPLPRSGCPSPGSRASHSRVCPSDPGINPFPLTGHLQLFESECGQTLSPLHLLLHPVPAPSPRSSSAGRRAAPLPGRSGGYLQHQPDLTPSSPAHLASAPWWGPRVVEEAMGTPFSSSQEGYGSRSHMFPLPLRHRQSLSPAPENTQPPRELGQGQELKSCTASTDTTESPSLPTHHKQPSVKKNHNRHTQEISETSK